MVRDRVMVAFLSEAHLYSFSLFRNMSDHDQEVLGQHQGSRRSCLQLCDGRCSKEIPIIPKRLEMLVLYLTIRADASGIDLKIATIAVFRVCQNPDFYAVFSRLRWNIDFERASASKRHQLLVNSHIFSWFVAVPKP